jgi:hypothetical protein
MTEPIPIDPERVEERGEFPIHSDRPRPVLSAEEARLYAFLRLTHWRATHGD